MVRVVYLQEDSKTKENFTSLDECIPEILQLICGFPQCANGKQRLDLFINKSTA